MELFLSRLKYRISKALNNLYIWVGLYLLKGGTKLDVARHINSAKISHPSPAQLLSLSGKKTEDNLIRRRKWRWIIHI